GMAVAPLKSAVNLDKLGKAQGGQIISAGGEKVLETTDGRFFVPLAPQLLGAVRSDNRQDVTRWLRYAKTAQKSQQSQYLNRSVFNFGTRFHILVAVDTEDLFSRDQLRTAVAESKVVFADRK